MTYAFGSLFSYDFISADDSFIGETIRYCGVMLLKDLGPLLPKDARFADAMLNPETGHLTFLSKDGECFVEHIL